MQNKEGSGCRRAEPFDPTLPRLPVLIAGRLAKEVEVFLRGSRKEECRILRRAFRTKEFSQSPREQKTGCYARSVASDLMKF
jgi:hypothetical protein